METSGLGSDPHERHHAREGTHVRRAQVRDCPSFYKFWGVDDEAPEPAFQLRDPGEPPGQRPRHTKDTRRVAYRDYLWMCGRCFCSNASRACLGSVWEG